MISAQMTEIIFLYLFPILATLLGMFVLIVWIWIGPDLRTCIKKKLGLMSKNKTLTFVAYDDRYIGVKALNVTTEGTLKNKLLTFLMGRSTRTTDNPEYNLQSERRDRDMLPPYNFAGMPVFFAHVARAIVTNPRVLTAFKLDNMPKGLDKKIAIKMPYPQPQTVKEKYVDDDGVSRFRMVLKRAFEVTLLVPFDFSDITKHFDKAWSQARMITIKKRHELIGQKKLGQDMKSIIIPIIIVSCVCMGAMVLLYLLTGGVI